MVEFISVPFKKPSDIDLVKPLKNIISAQYNTSDNPDDFNEAIEIFNKLRATALWKMYEKYESSLEVVYNYFDELSALDEKLSGTPVNISFKWKDAFDKGSIFSGRSSLTISSLKFEIVCILFNIAALQSAVASAQNLDSDDGLRLAAKLFQQAAGIFQILKSTVMQALKQDPTPDLHPDTTGFLCALMVAQAQEVFVLKAIRDQMKDPITAKLSSQCNDYYAEAAKLLHKESVRCIIPAQWSIMINSKCIIMHGIAQYFQSLVCKANKDVGEEISRLQVAVQLIKDGIANAGKALYQDYMVKATRVLAEAEKDNNFIYHERIPEFQSLDRVPKASLAKPLPFQTLLGSHFEDLFQELVPVSVHQALAAYDVRKTELMNYEVNRLRESTQLLNSMLASLNLPAALEDTSGISLPPSLVQKSESVRSMGGIEKVDQKIRELPELVQRNQQILDEAERMLNDEKQSDDTLRAQFKEKWTRSPSDKLTEPIRSNAQSYKQMLSTALNANKVVQEQYYQHKKAVELLSAGKDAIENALPSGLSGSTFRDSSCIKELKRLMEEVEVIKAERDSIESELKSATTDMKSTFLKALSQDGAIKESEVSSSSLEETYGPLRNQIDLSIANQDSLLSKIQALNTEFCKEKGDTTTGNRREAFLKELAAGYDAFMELIKHLEEGTKFFNDLTEHLVTFQNKISDFCFARKTEKEELMKTLTQELSRTTGNSAANAPSMPSSINESNRAQYGQSNVVDGSTTLPYPVYPVGMPMPYAPVSGMPYPSYPPPPMPTSYNPYATLPHMHGFPQYQASSPYPQQQYSPYGPQYQPPRQ